jgi:hypothetical protein
MTRLAPLVLALSALPALAGVGDWTPEKVEAEIAKHAQDVHHVRVQASHGGAGPLLRGKLGQEGAGLDVVFHAKVDSAGGARGDGVIAYQAHPGRPSAPPKVRSSYLFPLTDRLPGSAGEASDLFDRIMGEGARGGIYGGRSFTPRKEGGWELYGAFEAPGKPWKVQGYIALGPDDDDPGLTVLMLFADVEMHGE